MQRPRRVGERPWIQNDSRKPFVDSCADPVDEHAFVVALTALDGNGKLCGKLSDLGVHVSQRLSAIYTGLASPEAIEVRTTDDEHRDITQDYLPCSCWHRN